MSCNQRLLEDCTKDTPEFSLCGLTLKGKVIECYDADTCKIALPVFDNFYKFTCRLNGIDTPEMKPLKSKPNRDNEILWAKKARAELLKLICNNNLNSCFDNLDIKKTDVIKELQNNKTLVNVRALEWDKYGRLLVELYNCDETDLTFNKSFNNILVEKNVAVAYGGGTKINPWS
jgi:endonuclease YncB( thermonuclease family)